MQTREECICQAGANELRKNLLIIFASPSESVHHPGTGPRSSLTAESAMAESD